jgi:hypothetical protein
MHRSKIARLLITVAVCGLGLAVSWLALVAAETTEVVTTKAETSEVRAAKVVLQRAVYFPLVMLPAAVHNGNFESGGLAPWQAGGALLSQQPIRTTPTPLPTGKPAGIYAALLGMPVLGSGNAGGIPIGSAWITQTARVPVTNTTTLSAALRLTLWYRLLSHDTQWNGALLQDTLDVTVAGVLVFRAGNPTAVYGQPEPWDSQWQCQRIDLPALIPSEPVELRVEVHNRNDAYYNTWAYVDDIVFGREVDCPR